ncbi:MAG: hypothetical protein Q9N67_06805 [Ghiorsea sp.]|nr:hypothetical protein [Ghiorsea sp.]
MNIRNKYLKIIAFTSTVLLTPTAGSTAANSGEHAMFQIFFNEGTKIFPNTVEGKHIEEAMRSQGFDIMLSTQSAGLHNGDVWSVQNNTLRHLDNKLVDFGIGCNLVMKIEPVKAGGVCHIYMGEHDKESTQSMYIVQSPIIQSETTWYKVFEDSQHGIAGYMTHEVSDLFHQ